MEKKILPLIMALTRKSEWRCQIINRWIFSECILTVDLWTRVLFGDDVIIRVA